MNGITEPSRCNFNETGLGDFSELQQLTMRSSLRDFMARQYARPSGWFGRWVIARLLNRSNQFANNLVFETLKVQANERVLEVGFGGGALLSRIVTTFPRNEVVGIELSEEMLASMRHQQSRAGYTNLTLSSGTVEALPLNDSSVDCVCTVNTVYFWPNIAAGLGELRRVLRPGGRLVIGIGSEAHMRRAGYEEGGFSLYTPEAMATALEAAGFIAEEPSSVARGELGPFFACTGIAKK